MKKTCISILLIILLLISSFSVTTSQSIFQTGENNDVKEWTVMIYGKQECLMFWCPFTIKALLRGTHSGENINVVVIQDRVFTPTIVYSINEHGRKKGQKHLGELNMGDAETITDFINYCKTNYPAERYHLEICGHGMGWMDAGWDISSNYDLLEVREIKNGVKEAGGVDILTFFGNCNMGNLECFYELRNVTDVVIGSEALGSFNRLVIPTACEFLNNNPSLSTYEISIRFIEIVEESMNKTFSLPYQIVTLSAVRTDKLQGLINSINDLSTNLIDNMDLYFDIIKSVFKNTFKFGIFMEFYDFIDKLYNQRDLSETTKQYLQNVMDSFNQTIIANFHADTHPNAHGLTINSLSMGAYYYASRLYNDIKKLYGCTKYFKTYGVGRNFYFDSKIEFINDSLWDEFLYSYDLKLSRVAADGTGDYVTIQNAIDDADEYDLIYICNGIYYENIVISKPLTIIGESYDSVIVDGKKLGNVISIKSDKVNLFDLSITNSSKNGAGVFTSYNETIIFNCNIYNNYNGLYLKNSFNSKKICCNNFSNNKKYGVYLESSCLNQIYQNFFDNNGEDVSFLNSYANLWDNRYLKNPKKQITLIKGYRTIFEIPMPQINFDFTHHLWYFDPLRIKIVSSLFLKEK